ncbi:MAG: TonB-dependent receptor [Proteobacteria bacterium]|nr:TonB-dependent receptor [Pseudomonadota bacterium]
MKPQNTNKSYMLKRTTMASAISLALLTSANVWAEETVQEPGMMEVVMVTANRREESVLEVPYNISTVSGDFINNAQIVDNAELMRYIPGVAVVDRGHRNSGVINSIMIRGLNVDGSALGDYALSTVPTVSTYINDTPIYANFLLKDIERVEVLRGPQGTLYGSGSLGGTVKYILNRPQITEFGGKVTGELSTTDGSDGTNWNADLMLNIPIGETMAARFVGGKLDNAGVVDYVNVYELDSNRLPIAPDGPLADTAVYKNVKDADTVEIEYARLSFLFEPNDAFSALFTYATQSDDIGGRRQQTVGQDGWGDNYKDYQNGSIQLEPSSRDADLLSLEMDLDLGFATLTSSTSSYDQDGESISENTGFYAQNNWLSAFYYNYPRPMAEARRTYADEAFIQEFRLVSDTGGKFDYTVGAFYLDQDLDATQESYLRGFKLWTETAWGPGFVVSDRDFFYARQQNYTDLSFFGELTWHFSDTFRMTVGGRYYDTDFTNDTVMGVGLWTGFSPEDTAFFKSSDSGSLFKVNFSYDLNDAQLLYGTISEGYRRGGANAVPLVGIFAEDPAWQNYDPDTTTNYEFGIKGLAGRVQYSFATFYVDWEDIQINTATTNWGFFAAQNGGDARTMGLEAELNGSFGNQAQWQYSLGYAYVNAELTEDVYAPSDHDQLYVTATDGTRLPGTPEHSFNASLAHTQTLSNNWDWTNRFSIYVQSDTENAINASDRFAQNLDGFSLLNFSTSLEMQDWTAAFWIKNLTNEEGVTGVFKEEYMGTDPAQNYFGNGSKQFIAQPRTIGVTVSYHF